MTEAATNERAPSVGPHHYNIELDFVVQSKTNPRKTFDQTKLDELAASIERVGILQPILVRHVEDRFEIVAGERRFRAAKQLGLKTIPAIVRELSDVEALEAQTVENLQRDDLHPLEEAEGYRQLMKRHGQDVARIAERVGRSVKYVYDRVKLLQLVKPAQKLFLEGRIAAGHAILLARLSPKDQERAIDADGPALFQHENSLFTPEEEEALEGKKDPYVGLKSRSVRELQAWIDKNVRFERDPDPMLFPETDLELRSAREKAEKIIPITHEYHVQPEAKAEGERTWGPMSWHRADGLHDSKTCDQSVLGVIVVGPGRGEAFRVCTAKEKCSVHWADWQRDRKKRQAGAGNTAKANDRYAREREKQEQERKREEAERVRWKKATPAILEAVAAAVAKAPVEVGSLLEKIVTSACLSYDSQKGDADLVPRGTTAEDLVRRCAFIVLASEARQFSAQQHFPKRAKAFNVGVAKILDEVAPVQAEAPAKTKPAKSTKKKTTKRRATKRKKG